MSKEVDDELGSKENDPIKSSQDKIAEGLKKTKEPEDNSKDADGDKDSEGEKLSEKERELLKEVMKKKEKAKELEAENKKLAEDLKKFDGIDLEEVKKLLAEKAAIEAQKKDEERKALEAKGEIEKIKELMKADNEARVNAEKNRADELAKQLEDVKNQTERLAIDNAFNSSKFIKDELILSPELTKKVFGEYFGIEDGVIVAYDKPKYEEDKTILVDADGDNLGFEDAVKKIIDGYADKDSIIKSKIKQGANSMPSKVSINAPTTKPVVHGIERIQLGLQKKNKK